MVDRPVFPLQTGYSATAAPAPTEPDNEKNMNTRNLTAETSTLEVNFQRYALCI